MVPIEVGTASPDVFGAAGTWTLNGKVETAREHPIPQARRPAASHRGGPDLGHRQLRRHLHPGFPGRQGGRPEPGTDRLLDLVHFRGRRPDRRLAELPLPGAHHHRLVHPRRRFPHRRAAHHALCRNDRRLHALRRRLHGAGRLRLFRAGGEDDSPRHRRRLAGRHPAALRHRRLRRRRHGPAAGGGAGADLCPAAPLHRSLCHRRRAGGRHPAAARARPGQLRRGLAEAGPAGVLHAGLLGECPAQRGPASFRHHPHRPVHAGHAGAAQRRLQDQRQPHPGGDRAGLPADGALRLPCLQRRRHHRRHLHRQGIPRGAGQTLHRRPSLRRVLHPGGHFRHHPGGPLRGAAARLHHHPGRPGPARRHRRQSGHGPGGSAGAGNGPDHLSRHRRQRHPVRPGGRLLGPARRPGGPRPDPRRPAPPARHALPGPVRGRGRALGRARADTRNGRRGCRRLVHQQQRKVTRDEQPKRSAPAAIRPGLRSSGPYRPRSGPLRGCRICAAAEFDRADRLGEHRQPRRAGNAGLGAHQQVRGRLSGPALLRRLRPGGWGGSPGHRPGPEPLRLRLRQRAAPFRQPGQPGRLSGPAATG
ncbi:hypothetical protein Lal_00035666 [Lupinus albus]|nr:hypothetical protein Lal_00035666 [Lupinus albus]